LGVQERFAGFFNLLFPDECRLCEQPLRNISRIPVCRSCLSLPKPLEAEFSCKACGTPFENAFPLDEHDLCTVCRQSRANLDATYSFGSYEGPLRQLIHLYKYGKVESLAGPLCKLLVRTIPVDRQFDIVIAMPMHWRKRLERGFNQAELLAKPIAKLYGLRLSSDLLQKRYGKAQASLSAKERHENLKDSFRVAHAQRIAGKRILLVDDVITTGATLRAASAALKAAGARHVSALTLARVDDRWRFDMSSKPSAKPSTRAARATEAEVASFFKLRSVYDGQSGSTS
jgi:ComF family protein